MRYDNRQSRQIVAMFLSVSIHIATAAIVTAFARIDVPHIAGQHPGVANGEAFARRSVGAEFGGKGEKPLPLPLPRSTVPVPASRANEDFESGTLSNWRFDQRGAGGWFVYSDGKTPPDRTRTDSAFPFDVPDPPQGHFAAVTQQNGPGRFILFRDVMLDGRYQLHVTPFYVNLGQFKDVLVSSQNEIDDEQQYRIDIVVSSAPVDSIAPEHILVNILETKSGDPARRLPMEVTADLSSWEGRTVRLRLAVGENQAPLRAGIDNIRFERMR